MACISSDCRQLCEYRPLQGLDIGATYFNAFPNIKVLYVAIVPNVMISAVLLLQGHVHVVDHDSTSGVVCRHATLG